ncbi:MAG: hypothetical protein IJ599_03740 [Alphaproteobacteria bacterium]|nr:hypothetical protein [Alphaproteobacteria bacterium]
MAGEISTYGYNKAGRCRFSRHPSDACGVYGWKTAPQPSKWSELFKNSSDSRLINRKNKIDGVKLLQKLRNHCAKVVFFDPQYRGVLDKLSYGN